MPAAAAWEAAVDLGARGRYAEAEALLTPLVSAARSTAGDRWRSLALSLLGSHRRQVGDVTSARQCDTEALQAATDAESRAEALIGLAADAVASGDADSAAEWHADAAADAAEAWRTLTRWHWVGAERALLAGDRSRAEAHARDACAACAGRSARHEAKSRIILAAVSGHAEDLPAVGRVLRDGGWVTLEWPLALVAADHPEGLADSWLADSWLAEAWETGRAATYTIEEGLPEGLREVWRAQPGVRRLRVEGPPTGGE